AAAEHEDVEAHARELVDVGVAQRAKRHARQDIPARPRYAARMLIAAACALLTFADIAAVQGERPTQQKESSGGSAELGSETCFYALPTFAKSVSLEVTRGRGVAAHWRKSFHERRSGKENEKEKEKEKEKED